MAGDPPEAPVGQAWTTGLCDCCDDCNSCCLTFFCPCVAFGLIAETLDRGSISCAIAGITYCWMRPSTVLPGMHTMYSWSYRQKLRATFGMAPEPCADCCLQLFCDRCSLSQMYRELKNRGVNPANGWVVNSQKMTSAPIPLQDMRR
uniref:Cadmium resistance protein n=1 Tax=Oryza glumipatula TaxID=40148 RepID=A0A0E0AAA4_9ORYZ